MKFKWFFLRVLAALVLNTVLAAYSQENFDATTETVGHNANGTQTPVNQLLTPAGAWVPLPGIRPNALALSPDGKLLVTSGLTDELLAVDPVTGKILQHVSFPTGANASEAMPDVILNAKENPKLSLTGLAFSPDGSRIYLSDVNGDIKVFGVGQDNKIGRAHV